MSLIIRYWKTALARGDAPRAVWAVVSTGREQPEGYIIGWSVSKRGARRDLDKRQDANAWRLVRMVPS